MVVISIITLLMSVLMPLIDCCTENAGPKPMLCAATYQRCCIELNYHLFLVVKGEKFWPALLMVYTRISQSTPNSLLTTEIASKMTIVRNNWLAYFQRLRYNITGELFWRERRPSGRLWGPHISG
ncbi:MAG: hypothetical protein ACYSTG_04030 [Planctomycetota bacterium]